MAQGKKKKVDGKWVKLPQEDWITVKDTHEAIIPQSDFDIVARQLQQETMKRNNMKKHIHELPENILSSLIFCAECGRAYIRMPKTKSDS